MWLARNKDNSLYLYENKPKKTKDKWKDTEESVLLSNSEEIFPEVKWEDKEPKKLVFGDFQIKASVI